MADQSAREATFERLSGYLAHDPDNVALLVDAAEAAIDAQRPDEAMALLDRAAASTEPGPRERNLAGLAAMQAKRFDRAADVFAALFDAGHDDPSVRFNLAWSRASLKDDDGALAALDDAAAEALPQAAALRVQLLHGTGQFEEAFERGKHYLSLHPDARQLNAAMAVLAIDMEDEALAAACAERAPDHPDALATLGTLALDGDDPMVAEALFDRAIDRNPEVPRAWIGRGLAHLLTGKAAEAPADIDRGAEMFGTHLGSWIAAGWAHFVNGDRAAARERFDRALAIDPTFAETHGSLAVLDILDGDLPSARERTQVALRLDRQCYSAALAMAMLSAGDGDAAKSQAIIERALTTPLGDSGRTIAQALARIGTQRGSLH
ncbi:tetratricopeptide repeat protein [Sphingomonas sp.]|uniref:tetratricopeptide repeat protein n=1 Tax=Sphingomonas sp. TaxID=28214 RepID=UPI002E36C6C7|nr:tetratricopeptide repeat protein [Sphingomonas sp.]HEX4695784.1 tetratricopeptide repeat protein [Sphingomonas sp.]